MLGAADVLVTPNGAHFVNAPFMAGGTLLIEGAMMVADMQRDLTKAMLAGRRAAILLGGNW